MTDLPPLTQPGDGQFVYNQPTQFSASGIADSGQVVPWPEGFAPSYTFPPPAVMVTVTWAATDGRNPESVVIEWRQPPPGAELREVTEAVIAAGGHGYEVFTDPTIDKGAVLRDAMGRVDTTPADPEQTVTLDHPTCPAQLDLAPGQITTHVHACKLDPGHGPVEPDGRQHRCYCGGLFATDEEMPSVPGRATQRRRTEQGR